MTTGQEEYGGEEKDEKNEGSFFTKRASSRARTRRSG
jgi:hypothetical protein